jgi:hypothetical protein
MRLVHELQPFLNTDITLALDMGSFHLWPIFNTLR